MKRSDIQRWLEEDDPSVLETLWRMADQVRRENVGDMVYLRGLLEISNHCTRRCAYCGIRADNKTVVRYRMNEQEILDAARTVRQRGYDTVVMQSGEDPGISADWLAGIIRRIKDEIGCVVTLSLGERSLDELELWKRAGADRYLLRFETSDIELYRRVHPTGAAKENFRMGLLKDLKSLGYEIGSGTLIGIPGQTMESLARDIELFAELSLDMIGSGPFLPHPNTPLGSADFKVDALPSGGTQVPPTELMGYKVVALSRLVCPFANIPSTTALATLNSQGRELGLMRGANVVMPNCTPIEYRSLYEIYPAKACMSEQVDRFHLEVRERIGMIGRIVAEIPDYGHGS